MTTAAPQSATFDGEASALPNGWCWARLHELCDDISDGTHFTPTYVPHGIPFLSVKDISGSEISFSNCRFISEEQHRAFCKRCKPEKGDVLYTKVGTTGIAKAVHTEREFSIFVSVALLKLSESVLPDYLELMLNSPIGRKQAAELTQGMANRNLVLRDLKQIRIPLAPVTEQRRIAGRLREQLAAVAQARAAVQAQTETLDTLSHAVLRESLSNGNTQPVRFADCLRDVTEGIGDDWRKYPVLGATRAGLAPAKEGVGKNPGRYKPVRAGTIFYNPMRILLGSIAMLDEDDTPGITSPDYVVMTAVEGRLSARWFYHWFRSRYGAEFIKSMTRGAVRERLMFRRLAPATLVLPDWKRQQTAAGKFAEIKKAKAKLAEKLEALDHLPAALLREAFNGKP